MTRNASFNELISKLYDDEIMTCLLYTSIKNVSMDDLASSLGISCLLYTSENNNEVGIKSLGTPETKLMVNIKPNKSTIDVYQNLFKNK